MAATLNGFPFKVMTCCLFIPIEMVEKLRLLVEAQPTSSTVAIVISICFIKEIAVQEWWQSQQWFTSKREGENLGQRKPNRCQMMRKATTLAINNTATASIDLFQKFTTSCAGKVRARKASWQAKIQTCGNHRLRCVEWLPVQRCIWTSGIPVIKPMNHIILKLSVNVATALLQNYLFR